MLIKIKKTKKIKGSIDILGSKNSSLPIIAASLLVNGIITLNNVPNIKDINHFLCILEELDINYKFNNHKLIIYSNKIDNLNINSAYVKTFRGSYYLMGVLLSRYKKLSINLPGGCDIGKRPIDYHLEGFKLLNTKLEFKDDLIYLNSDKLKGNIINLKSKSVGATLNILFASLYAEGKTIINNPSIEPEVKDCLNFLIKLGFDIKDNNTNLEINGLNDIINIDLEYSIIPDRIEALSYTILGLLLGKPLIINNINYDHIKTVIDLLIDNNARISIGENSLVVRKSKIKSFSFETKPFPFIPTDIMQILGLLLIKGNKESFIKDNIYDNRYNSYIELNKLGCNIKQIDNVLYIKGVKKLKGNTLEAKDLRGACALIISGLISNNTTYIKNYEYVLRGYDDFINKLIKLGAKLNPL